MCVKQECEKEGKFLMTSPLVKMKITGILCTLFPGIKLVPLNCGERQKERENTYSRARGHVTREACRK